MADTTQPVDYPCAGTCGSTYPGHMLIAVDGKNYCRDDAPTIQAVTAPRPESRWTLANAGNRALYAFLAAVILTLAVDNTMPGSFVFLAALGVGYLLLTLIHNTRRDSTEETP